MQAGKGWVDRVVSRVLLPALVLAVLVAASTAVASRQGPAACPAGSKRAVIGGKVKCLRSGQKCAAKYQAAYKKYGFVCVGGKLRKRQTTGPHPPPVTPPPPPPPSPPPPPAVPGHYKGTDSQLEVIEFDVTSDGTRVVSLATGQINVGCNPPLHLYGGNVHDASAPINTSGDFKIDEDYKSFVGDDPSTGHFTLAGHFNGTSWTGTLQDSVQFVDQGTAYSCGSGLQTWTAARTG